MKINYFSFIALTIIWLVIFSACTQSNKKKSAVVWTKDIPVIGSMSSPRTADLNNDGVLDIVMGAGKNEFEKTPSKY